jgi:hypothetical protein
MRIPSLLGTQGSHHHVIQKASPTAGHHALMAVAVVKFHAHATNLSTQDFRVQFPANQSKVRANRLY